MRKNSKEHQRNNGKERHQRRLDALKRKQEKVGVLEALIHAHEHAASPDFEEIRKLKRKLSEVRTQLNVTSTRTKINLEDIA